MKYFSTRNDSLCCTAAQAIAMGLAPDGGLFVPETIPIVTTEEIRTLCAMDYRARAVNIMQRYLPEFTAAELEEFVTHAYADNFDSPAIAPLRFTDDATAYLELWHGPTCAFKDMALQMLPYLLTASLKKTGETRQVCILVATSGDTGKAALEGFADVPGTRIFVFYPSGGVSEIQRLQMVTQRGENVGVCAVKGNFDDAQTGVKQIFGDAEFAAELSRRGFFLSSANSINWGRLLPQIVYYFSAYCDYVNAGKIAAGEALVYCVPTGNFGNILAGWFAAKMGLPVKRFVCASNANDVLTEFIRTGVYNKNRPFHLTISPSMDILVSSNLERLLYMHCGAEKTGEFMAKLTSDGCYDVGDAVRSEIGRQFYAACCDDEMTRARIAKIWRESGYLIDTHTAVAADAIEQYRVQTGDGTPAVIVSTASPFKFAADVCVALGADAGADPLAALSAYCAIPTPAPLSGLGDRPVRFDGVTEKADMRATVNGFLR